MGIHWEGEVGWSLSCRVLGEGLDYAWFEAIGRTVLLFVEMSYTGTCRWLMVWRAARQGIVFVPGLHTHYSGSGVNDRTCSMQVQRECIACPWG